MIVVAILALSGVVLTAIIAVFGNGLPELPSSVMSAITLMQGYLAQGASVFWNYVHPAPVKAMFGLTLVAIVIYEGYKFVMWFAKKVPMFGVDD